MVVQSDEVLRAANVKGVVLDPSGAPIGNARVRFRCVEPRKINSRSHRCSLKAVLSKVSVLPNTSPSCFLAWEFLALPAVAAL
jgi:hypothetical protein